MRITNNIKPNKLPYAILLLASLLVFLFASSMAKKMGAEVIQSDYWRFLFIFGDYVVTREGSLFAAAAKDHHFDLVNATLFIADYALFGLSIIWTNVLSFLCSGALGFLLFHSVIRSHPIHADHNVLLVYLFTMVFPTLFFVSSSPQYVVWNLVSMAVLKVFVVYGLLVPVLFVNTSSQLKVYILTTLVSLTAALLSNTMATIVCLALVCAFLGTWFLGGVLELSRIAGILTGLFGGSVVIKLVGFESASLVVAGASDIINGEFLLQALKGLAYAFFAPYFSKEILTTYPLVFFLIFSIFCSILIFMVRMRGDFPTTLNAIIFSLFIVYCATYASAMMFRFGYGDPQAVAFVPRYQPMYMLGMISVALSLLCGYLALPGKASALTLSLFLIIVLISRVDAFDAFSKQSIFQQRYFDQVRVSIFCGKDSMEEINRMPKWNSERRNEALLHLEENNLNVFFLNSKGYYYPPLLCDKVDE